MDEDSQPVRHPLGPRHWLAFGLYLPVLGALAYLIVLCLFLLAHGKPAGVYGFMYAGVALVLGRRAFSIYEGGVAASRLWPDIVLLGLCCALLTVMALDLRA